MGESDEVKLVVAIVDRGRGARVVDVYRECRLPFDFQCMARGTANSKVLDYLGLSETLKDMVFGFARACDVKAVFKAVDERLGLSHPGRGILFSVPLTGASGKLHQALSSDSAPCGAPDKAEATVKTSSDFDMIVAVIDHGNEDVVMDAACSCGARGGTVIHGRRMGVETGDSLLGMSFDIEKDVLIILVPHVQKMDVMRAVNKAAGPATPCHGVLFSVPVDDAIGLRCAQGCTSPAEDDCHPYAESSCVECCGGADGDEGAGR